MDQPQYRPIETYVRPSPINDPHHPYYQAPEHICEQVAKDSAEVKAVACKWVWEQTLTELLSSADEVRNKFKAAIALMAKFRAEGQALEVEDPQSYAAQKLIDLPDGEGELFEKMIKAYPSYFDQAMAIVPTQPDPAKYAFQEDYKKDYYKFIKDRDEYEKKMDNLFYMINMRKRVESGELTHEQASVIVQQHMLEQCNTGLTYEEYQARQKAREEERARGDK